MYLLAYYNDKGKHILDITNEDISRTLKAAATVLDYPDAKGLPFDRIDTHSLHSGNTNALSLAGYSDTQIQKMGCWWGATFKEYNREELACFSEGSTSMKTRLGIPIFGSDFWDPHWKWNFDSIFDSKDSGWKIFLKFRC